MEIQKEMAELEELRVKLKKEQDEELLKELKDVSTKAMKKFKKDEDRLRSHDDHSIPLKEENESEF